MSVLKKLACIGGALFLFLPFALPAAAQDGASEILGWPLSMGGMLPPGGGDDDGTVKILTGIRTYEGEGATLYLANVGDDPGSLGLPQDIECYVEGQEEWDTYYCPVTWDYSEVDNSSPGRVSIPGLLQPAGNYTLHEDFPAQVSYDAVIFCQAGMAQETLAEVEFGLTKNGYLAVLGEDPANAAISSSAFCYSDRREFYRASVVWDYSTVDRDVTGTYPVSGTLSLPACFAAPDGAQTVYSSQVFVVDPNAVDLTAVTRDDDEEVYCEWLFQVPQPKEMVIECAVGSTEGEWVLSRDEDYYYGGDFLYGGYSATSLTVEKDKLLPETDYYFRIRYEDAVSNILHVNIGEGNAEEPILLESVDPVSYQLVILPVGDDLSGLELPKTILCTYSRWFSAECAVAWGTAGVSTDEPGWIRIKGDITPPAGYRCEEDFVAYHPVMLIEGDMEKEPLASVVGAERFFLVGRGTEAIDWLARKDYLERTLPSTVSYETQNQLWGEAPVTWDFSPVDTAKTGVYRAVGTVELPVCFALPEGEQLFDVSVAVVEPDRIDLSAFRPANSMNRVGSSRWLYTVEDHERIALDYALGDDAWQRATVTQGEAGMMYAEEVPCYYSGNTLTVQLSQLAQGEHYFRLLFNGEYSNVLHISVDENLVADWDIGGDRGGADQDPQDPPIVEQPAPEPDGSYEIPGDPYDRPPASTPDTSDESRDESKTEPPAAQEPQAPAPDSETVAPLVQPPEEQDIRESPPSGTDGGDVNSSGDSAAERDPADRARGQAPTLTVSTDLSRQTEPEPEQNADDSGEPGRPMLEYSTASTLSISGLRLKEMLAVAGNTVLFEKQGVSVELPSDFLSGLEIEDTSRFEVHIEKRENGFVLELLLDDIPLSALPPTTVYAPFSLADGMDSDDLACFDGQGREVSAAVYDTALQIVRVKIEATGAYTIAPRSSVDLPVSVPEPDASADAGPADFSEGTDGANDKTSGWLVLSFVGVITAALCAGFILLRRRRRIGAGGDG